MTSVPAVTVVIPTRDRPGLLRETLGTVLAQRSVDVRVLVVDDGSTVPTAETLPDDARVRVHRHASSEGVSAARNTGLGLTDTPWVAFVDDDDLWSPHKLRRQLEAVAGTGFRWACSAAANFTGDEILDVHAPPPVEDLSDTMRHGNYVPGGGSGVLVSTELARDVGGFDPSLSSLADWDCWIRLAVRSPVGRVSAPDVGYRVHAASMQHDVGRQGRELRALQVKYGALPEPILIEPDEHFLAYWARLEYRSGNWQAGLARTVDLVLRHGRVGALTTPARHALPPKAQRSLRARRLARTMRSNPDHDLTWLRQHLRRATAAG